MDDEGYISMPAVPQCEVEKARQNEVKNDCPFVISSFLGRSEGRGDDGDEENDEGGRCGRSEACAGG